MKVIKVNIADLRKRGLSDNGLSLIRRNVVAEDVNQGYVYLDLSSRWYIGHKLMFNRVDTSVEDLDPSSATMPIDPPSPKPAARPATPGPIPPSVWGPKKWLQFHQSVYNRKGLIDFTRTLPGGCSCKGDFGKKVNTRKPPKDNLKLEWDWWKVDIHNDVTIGLFPQKEKFSDEDAIKLYNLPPRPPSITV